MGMISRIVQFCSLSSHSKDFRDKSPRSLSRAFALCSLALVLGACATAAPTLTPPGAIEAQDLQSAYNKASKAYDACLADYRENSFPYQTYVAGGSGALALAGFGAATTSAFTIEDWSVRGPTVAGLSLLSLAGASVATYFGAQIPPTFDAREYDLATLQSAKIEIEGAQKENNAERLTFLSRQLFEDCRAIRATKDGNQAKVVLKDLEGYRKDLLDERARNVGLQGAQKGLEGENASMSDALKEAQLNAEKLQRRMNALDGAASEREAKVNALRSEVRNLEDERAKLSNRERALLAEKRKLEEKKSYYEDVASALKQEVESGRVALRRLRDGVVVEMPNKVLFPSGRAQLNDAGKNTLEKVAAAIVNIKDRRIRVEGHTDNVPLSKGASFVDNWELSTERALTVTRFLQTNGVSSSKLSAEGRSEFAPAASNDTKEGRAKNRRIEIYLVAPNDSAWTETDAEKARD